MNLQRVEKYIFYLLIILNVLPVLISHNFPTLDGPAHIYNSQLLKALLFDSNTVINESFQLNKELVPNWTGHFIIGGLSLIMPVLWAHKVLLLFILIGLPLAFRLLVNSLDTKLSFLSYFIFLFTYTNPFFYGFYNFCIALVLMLFILAFWIRNESTIGSKKQLFGLTILLMLLYLSHLFVLGITLLLIGFYILFQEFLLQVGSKESIKNIIIQVVKKSSPLVLTSIIPLGFSIYYFTHRKSEGTFDFMELGALFDRFTMIHPIIGLDQQSETPYTRFLFFLFLFVLIVTVVFRIIKSGETNDFPNRKFSNLINKNDFWLTASAIMLGLYFIMPESATSGGFITMRLSIVSFILFTIWIAVQKIPKWLGLAIAVLVLFCHFKLMELYHEHTIEASAVVQNCIEVSEYIEESSVVLPINLSNNWYKRHYSNYLGIEKSLVILENYECEKDYFPVIWKNEVTIEWYWKNLRPDSKLTLPWNPNGLESEIDYVFVLGQLFESESETPIESIISRDYKFVFENDDCELYVKK